MEIYAIFISFYNQTANTDKTCCFCINLDDQLTSTLFFEHSKYLYVSTLTIGHVIRTDKGYVNIVFLTLKIIVHKIDQLGKK